MADKNQFLMRGLLHAFYWCDESLQSTVRARGYPPLSRTKSMIMVNISDGMTRSADLARNIGISRQAVHQTLDELAADGLINLRPDEKDRRAKVVHFSRRGKGHGEAAYEALSAIEDELARRLGRRTVEELKRILFSDWGPVLSPKLKVKESSRPTALSRRRAVG